MKSYLNLGCGTRFRSEWTNIDFVAAHPSIVSHNLREGLPFPDNSADVVYHSHVLEHFSRREAHNFVRECHRVLKPGGAIRVVVPDLENIASAYLETLNQAARVENAGESNYEWMMIELYDQTVRDKPGGDMADYLRRKKIPNLDFVLDRGGAEVQAIIAEAQRTESVNGMAGGKLSSLSETLKKFYRSMRRAGFGRELLLRLLLGSDYQALQLGRFRCQGEPHLWMYDRYSLLQVLTDNGFRDARLRGPAESRIEGWANFQLDTEADGAVYKPFSLYAEAVK